jgi:hypothetical protein
MKYLCLVFYDEEVRNALSDHDSQALIDEAQSFDEDMRRSGHLITAFPLEEIYSASAVRVRNGKPTVTDGPFTETNEQIGGFVLLEANDLNEAIQLASRIPPARLGGVEVRPIMELNPTPEQAPSPSQANPRAMVQYDHSDRSSLNERARKSMKYLCMVYLDGAQMQSLSQAERRELDRQSLTYDESLKAKEQFVAAEALQPPASAVTLRFRKGEMAVTDGPFVETHEHLGGFILVEARDKEEAIEIASGIPVVHFGGAEVRPIIENPVLEYWKEASDA